MRVSTPTLYERGITAIQDQTGNLLKINEQIAAMRRVLTPADDPVAAARAMEVTQSQSANDQYLNNQKAAENTLALEDTTLSQVGDLLQHIRQLAVDAGNGAYDNTNRGYIASELRSNLQQLMGFANTTDGNGAYLFSGYQGGVIPFSTTGGASAPVQYNGDQGQRLLQIDGSRQIPVSDSGAGVFMNVKNGNGTFAAAPAATNNGTGVINTGNVLDPTKWNAAGLSKDYSVKFRTLPTTTTPAPGAGNEIGISDTAAWTATGQTVNVTFGAGTYTVTDKTHGTTTGPIAYAGAPITIQGAGLSFNWDPGAGASFDISGSSTTYDIVDNVSGNSLVTGAAPPATGAYPRTYTSGQAIPFTNLAVPVVGSDYGVDVTIEGKPANNDSFTVKASSNESMFKTIDDLATLLEAGVRSGDGSDIDRAKLANGINKALANLSNDIDKVSTVRASVGSRLNEVEGANNLSQDMTTVYKKNLSDLLDLDFAKAVSDLSQQQAGLDAAQKAYTRVTGLSLFNYL